LAKELMDGVLPKLAGYRYERPGDGYLWFHNLEDALYAQEIITGYLQEKGVTSLKLERNGWGVTLVDVRRGKGDYLQRIVRRMGIKSEEIVAIGNSHNDESMLDRRMGCGGDHREGLWRQKRC